MLKLCQKGSSYARITLLQVNQDTNEQKSTKIGSMVYIDRTSYIYFSF